MAEVRITATQDPKIGVGDRRRAEAHVEARAEHDDRRVRDLRVGAELELLSLSRETLPREKLVELIGAYDTTLTRHIWESIVATSQICLHVRVLSGRNAHHVVEAQFKAFARALRDAVAIDPRETGVPSTKGAL